MKIPVLDNHIHLDPSGLRSANIKQFAKAGGTHAVIVCKPYAENSLQETGSYERRYELTLELARECAEAVPEVKIYVVLGPYPVDLIRLMEHMTLDAAAEVLKIGMELAQKYVEDRLAIAIGEIGRPHFPVSPSILKVSNEILQFGMACAKDADCPVVLHTESATESVWLELAKMADSVGLSREKVIKHFAPPVVELEANHGLFPSILSSRSNVRTAIARSDRFMMETDYLDDPNRPGAVLGIATVPKMTKLLLREGLATEVQVFNIHQNNPRKVYGIEFEL